MRKRGGGVSGVGGILRPRVLIGIRICRMRVFVAHARRPSGPRVASRGNCFGNMSDVTHRSRVRCLSVVSSSVSAPSAFALALKISYVCTPAQRNFASANSQRDTCCDLISGIFQTINHSRIDFEHQPASICMRNLCGIPAFST